MGKTQEDLKSAFAGEAQANRRYLAFAKAADKEEKNNLARLFRAVAEGETVHALNHLNALGGVKDSSENLKAAIEGETYEIETMYPEFISNAKSEKEKRAEHTFSQANTVEKIHQRMYKDALKKIEIGQDIEKKDYYVCGVCGYMALDQAPETCPICGAPKEKFIFVK